MTTAESEPKVVRDSDRFKALLAAQLPCGQTFELYHARSQPKKCTRLIYTSSKDKQPDAVSQNWLLLKQNDAFIFGLEVLVYNSRQYTTIFVSKADTSGMYTGQARLDYRSITTALLQGMLEYYATSHKPARVCLFARANPHYLFSGSDKNSRKHVLSDSQLLRWWLQCLSGLSECLSNTRARLLIPGDLGGSETSHLLANQSSMNWKKGTVFDPENPSESANQLAVHHIPRFPDDPKHRFLDDIVASHCAKSTSLGRFWTELESRQEFNLSSSVGIIGVEGSVKRTITLEGSYSLNKKYTTALEEVILSTVWRTHEEAVRSTENILAKMPSSALIEIVGQKSETKALPKRPPPIANVLGASMIKKKPKKNQACSDGN